jgi:hypothetical protein
VAYRVVIEACVDRHIRVVKGDTQRRLAGAPLRTEQVQLFATEGAVQIPPIRFVQELKAVAAFQGYIVDPQLPTAALEAPAAAPGRHFFRRGEVALELGWQVVYAQRVLF